MNTLRRNRAYWLNSIFTVTLTLTCLAGFLATIAQV